MTELKYDSVAVGDSLPTHTCGPISRTNLAMFAGASGDHNPIHIDLDFAKKSGMPDVFAHGMLSMAYLAQLLTNWVPQKQLREYGVRFTSITPIHATVTCNGKVVEKFEVDGEKRVKVEIIAEVGEGVKTLLGDAVIALD
ncbi:MAG: MaoC family dehydratase [Pseudomonadales bacterium]|nr:MaoC family dehydratase [Pseudomonadales bacterium]